METKVDNFIVPNYIAEEILEYIEQTAQGRCRCMKWENIRALLRLAMVNGRITKKQVIYIESIVFARTYYILFNLNYYISNPIEVFNIRSGGLAIYGGIIGAIITIIIYCKCKKINILDMLDFLIPYLSLRTINR